ncbi:MAG: hypothetical protein L0241_18210 [Planctomycetia bacterium]|nr:hypothetical protein [Planctomycetia bacterium]
MKLPPVPPTKDVLEALQNDLLPGAGAAALVMCAFLILGRWIGSFAAAAAVVAAFLVGNFTLVNLKTDPETGKLESPSWENTHRLVPWNVKADNPESPPPGWHWLPKSALILVVVGLVSRWVGMLVARGLPKRQWWGANIIVWAPRVVAIILISGWLTSGKAAEEWHTLRYQLAAVMLFTWIALDGVARSGDSAEVCLYTAAALLAGCMIMLYTGNARFAQLSLVMGGAMFGVGIATLAFNTAASSGFVGTGSLETDWVVPSPPTADASGAIPAAVVFLPGLVLGTRPSHPEHNVPVACFWLVALAPLVLLPFLIPWLNRQSKWIEIPLRAILILAPLVLAVTMAAEHEKLPFEKEW